MKRRKVSLGVPLLALAVSPAAAHAQDTLFDNGPINGTVDAWTINFGFVVSDSFDISAMHKGGTVIKGFDIGVWELPGDKLSSLDWSVTSGENGGTVFGSGTASGSDLAEKTLFVNEFGYNVDDVTVSGLNFTLPVGDYWLNLQNAVTTNGDPVFWDENSGVGCGGDDGAGGNCPALASENSLGTIPSEAFTIEGGESGSVPEPGTLGLMMAGILGFAARLRRKLF